jgi:hypothetical protein
MERTKRNTIELEGMDEEVAVRWRKIGGGTFRMASGRIIKPNQVFHAKPSEVPQGLRQFIIQLSGEMPDQENGPVVVPQKYSLQTRSPGWYDILDSQGKVINENALRQTQAREMLKSLTGQVVTEDA